MTGGPVLRVRRGVGCAPDGSHELIPDPTRTVRCACGTVSRVPVGDRYCIERDEYGGGICWCGRCPHYVALPGVDSREYRELVRSSLRKATEKNDRKRGRR